MPTVNGISFDRVVELNVSSGDEIGGPVNNALSSGVLVQIPPGSYPIRNQINLPGRGGIIGSPDNPADTRITIPRNWSFQAVNAQGSRNILVNGFQFYQHEDWQSGVTFLYGGRTNLKFLNVHVDGRIPPDSAFNPPNKNHGMSDYPNVIRTGAYNAGGTVLFRNVLIDGHGNYTDYPGNNNAFWIQNGHDGLVHLDQCHVENCGSNAVYGARNHGAIRATNCKFKNNDRSNMRVSGTVNDAAPRTELIGCDFHINDSETPSRWGGATRYTGVEIEFNWALSNATPDRVYIEDCDFYLQDASSARAVGGLLDFRFGDPPGAIIRSCRFRNDTSHDIFNIGSRQGFRHVEFHDCHVSGNVSTSSTGNVSFNGGAWCGPRQSGINYNDVASSGCTPPSIDGSPIAWGSEGGGVPSSQRVFIGQPVQDRPGYGFSYYFRTHDGTFRGKLTNPDGFEPGRGDPTQSDLDYSENPRPSAVDEIYDGGQAVKGSVFNIYGDTVYVDGGVVDAAYVEFPDAPTTGTDEGISVVSIGGTQYDSLEGMERDGLTILNSDGTVPSPEPPDDGDDTDDGGTTDPDPEPDPEPDDTNLVLPFAAGYIAYRVLADR